MSLEYLLFYFSNRFTNYFTLNYAATASKKLPDSSLSGVPILIKDLTGVRGVRLTRGASLFKDNPEQTSKKESLMSTTRRLFYIDNLRTFLTILVLVLLHRITRRLVVQAMVRQGRSDFQVKQFTTMWKYLFLLSGILFVVISMSGSLAAMGLTVAFVSMILGWSLQRPVTGVAGPDDAGHGAIRPHPILLAPSLLHPHDAIGFCWKHHKDGRISEGEGPIDGDPAGITLAG